MRKVNGKDLSEAMRILQESAPSERLQGKYPYWTIQMYHKRMDEAFGTMNYSIEFSDAIKADVLPNGQHFFSVKCRITIYDDDGKVICFKDGFGAREPNYAKDTNKDGGLKNLPNNASLAAFKAACHQFNIFSFRGAEEDDYSSLIQKSTKDARRGANKPKVENQRYEVNTNGDFVILKEDKNSGKPVYTLNASDSETKSPYLIIFYPNQYGQDIDTFNKLIAEQTKKKSLTLRLLGSVSSTNDGVESLVFKGYAK